MRERARGANARAWMHAKNPHQHKIKTNKIKNNECGKKTQQNCT